MDSSEWKCAGLVMKDSLNESKNGEQFSTTESQSGENDEEGSEMDPGTNRPGQDCVIRDWKLNSNVDCLVAVERMEASRFKSEIERHTYSQGNEMKSSLVKRQCTTGVKSGTDNGSFKCHVCLKMFRWPSTLEIHLRIHTGVKLFTCHVCNRQFLRRDHLKSHSFLHAGVRPYKCDVCQLGFTQKKTMDLHKKRCQNVRNPEPPLSKSRIKINGIRKRRKTKFHKCNVCSRKCGSPSKLTSHLRVHTGEKPFICSICKCGFRYPYTLKLHLVVHTGLKAFKCDICEREFGLKHSMLRHKRTVHAGKRHNSSMVTKQPDNRARIAERKRQQTFKDNDDKSRESVHSSDESESRDVRPSTSTPSSDSCDKPRDPEERVRQWTSFLTVFNAKMTKK